MLLRMSRAVYLSGIVNEVSVLPKPGLSAKLCSKEAKSNSPIFSPL